MSSIAKGMASASAPALRSALGAAVLSVMGIGGIGASAPARAQEVASDSANSAIEEVTVTARRREEAAQDVPIPVSVVSGQLITDVGAFNVNRIKELVPTVQLYSSNPRNTAVNIRGLGTTFGLTNDGIEGGVGFYVDGVYYARPAAQALDFIDEPVCSGDRLPADSPEGHTDMPCLVGVLVDYLEIHQSLCVL